MPLNCHIGVTNKALVTPIITATFHLPHPSTPCIPTHGKWSNNHACMFYQSLIINRPHHHDHWRAGNDKPLRFRNHFDISMSYCLFMNCHYKTKTVSQTFYLYGNPYTWKECRYVGPTPGAYLWAHHHPCLSSLAIKISKACLWVVASGCAWSLRFHDQWRKDVAACQSTQLCWIRKSVTPGAGLNIQRKVVSKETHQHWLIASGWIIRKRRRDVLIKE